MRLVSAPMLLEVMTTMIHTYFQKNRPGDGQRQREPLREKEVGRCVLPTRDRGHPGPTHQPQTPSLQINPNPPPATPSIRHSETRCPTSSGLPSANVLCVLFTYPMPQIPAAPLVAIPRKNNKKNPNIEHLKNPPRYLVASMQRRRGRVAIEVGIMRAWPHIASWRVRQKQKRRPPCAPSQ